MSDLEILLRSEIDRLTLALKTIRDMPLEEQDNMISHNMRLTAGIAMAPMGKITDADVAWAKAVIAARGV